MSDIILLWLFRILPNNTSVYIQKFNRGNSLSTNFWLETNLHLGLTLEYLITQFYSLGKVWDKVDSSLCGRAYIPAGCFNNWRWKNQKFCSRRIRPFRALETFITRRFSVMCKLYMIHMQNSIQTNLFLVSYLQREFPLTFNNIILSSSHFHLLFRSRYRFRFRRSDDVLCTKSITQATIVHICRSRLCIGRSNGSILLDDGVAYAFRVLDSIGWFQEMSLKKTNRQR